MSVPAKRKTQTSVDVDEIHDNTSTELINITVDKLKLILIDHVKKTEDTKAWQPPLGMAVTILLVFCSAQFQVAFGISADTWRAIFMIGGVVSFIWLCITLSKLRHTSTIDEVIDVIKNKQEDSAR